MAPQSREVEIQPFNWPLLAVILGVVGSAAVYSLLNPTDTSVANRGFFDSAGVGDASSSATLPEGVAVVSDFDANGVMSLLINATLVECGRMNRWDLWNQPGVASPTYLPGLPHTVNGAEILSLPGLGPDGVGEPPFWEIKGSELEVIASIASNAWYSQANGTLACDEAN